MLGCKAHCTQYIQQTGKFSPEILTLQAIRHDTVYSLTHQSNTTTRTCGFAAVIATSNQDVGGVKQARRHNTLYIANVFSGCSMLIYLPYTYITLPCQLADPIIAFAISAYARSNHGQAFLSSSKSVLSYEYARIIECVIEDILAFWNSGLMPCLLTPQFFVMAYSSG